MKWRIYYADGSVFTSDEGDPFDAPAIGVTVITQTDEYRKFRTVAGDYYVWRPWGFEACDLFGLWDYLSGPGAKTVKFGRTLSNRQFEEIFKRALEEGNTL